MNRKQEEAFLRLLRIEARHEQNGKCAYCRSHMKCRETTADHIVPRSLSGATTKDNIVAACEPCNRAKRSLSYNQFQNLIKHPPENAPWGIYRAHVRRKLSLRIERAEKRIANWGMLA